MSTILSNRVQKIKPSATLAVSDKAKHDALALSIIADIEAVMSAVTKEEKRFEDADGNQQRTETGNQTSALLNVGLGVRLAATTLNFAVGIGLTPDSPDFTFGINAPIRF